MSSKMDFFTSTPPSSNKSIGGSTMKSLRMGLPWHLSLGVLAADFGGLLTRRAYHHALHEHRDYVVRGHSIQEENFVCLASGKYFRSSRSHPRILDYHVPRTTNTERQRHVAGSPLGESDTRHFQVFLRIFEGIFVFELDSKEKLAVRIERPGVGLVEIL